MGCCALGRAEHRRRGVGAALVDKASELAFTIGAPRVYLLDPRAAAFIL